MSLPRDYMQGQTEFLVTATLAKNQVFKKRIKEEGKKRAPKLDFCFLSGDLPKTENPMEIKNVSKY